MTGASAQQPSPQRPHAPPTAADVMRPALSTVKPDDHVAAAAYLMKHAGATALGVVDDEQAVAPPCFIRYAAAAPWSSGFTVDNAGRLNPKSNRLESRQHR